MPFAWRLVTTLNDRIVAIPTDTAPASMFYRKDVLQAAGLDINTVGTWDDLVELGKKVTRDVNGDKKPDIFLIAHAASAADAIIRGDIPEGEGVYFDARGLPSVESPRFVKAFTVAQQIRKPGLDARITAWTNEWFEVFKRGTAAVEISGSWLQGHLQNWMAPDTAGKWGVRNLPENTYVSWGGTFWAIPEQSKNKEAAWKFIRLLTLRKDMQIESMEIVNAFPALKSVASLSVRWSWWQRRAAPYLFISPFYILFAIFSLYPIAFSFYLSFHSWNAVGGLKTMEWVGFENYTYLLTDPWFWQSLCNTLVLLVISGAPQHLIAIPLAFVLNSGLVRMRNFFTSSYFMPYITSTVAVAMIFSTIYGTQYGVLNALLMWMEKTPALGWLFRFFDAELPINWLGQPAFIKPAITILLVWRWLGWNTVLYLAGLQTIPRDLYEAAMVDGASAYQQFRWITVPLLKPTMFFAVTMTIIGTMQLFDEPFILTNGTGGTGQAGLTTVLYLYRTGFEWLYMGSAAAMSWMLVLAIGVLTYLNVKAFGRGALERQIS
ncbi:MAG: extracellular solute-binding protein [Bacillota bacterium]